MKAKRKHQFVKCVYVFFLSLLFIGSIGGWGYQSVLFWQNNEPKTNAKDTTVETLHSLNVLAAKCLCGRGLSFNWGILSYEEALLGDLCVR